MIAKRTIVIAVCLVVSSLSCGRLVGQESWPQFRGVEGNGVAPASARPRLDWDMNSDVVWQSEIPGKGWSSPVIDDGRIWITTAITVEATPEQIEKKRQGVTDAKIKTVAASVQFCAICIDLNSGKELHNKLLLRIEDPDLLNPLNSYASPTAAIENGKVICHFGNYGTWCLDGKTAETIWKAKYVVDHSVGPGSSPIICNGNVILTCDGIDKQYVVAVDLETGKQNWLTPRPSIRQDNVEHRKSFCTPFVIDVAGSKQVVIPAAQWIVAYEPGTGNEIWRAKHGLGFSIAPVPVYESGLVVFSTGYLKPEFVAVDPTGAGDVTESHIKWRAPGAPTMPSLLAADGQVIAINEKGILRRMDANSGELLERVRVGGNHSASPILANGHVYCSSREGSVSVYRVKGNFEKVSSNSFKDPILATPAVYQNDLIIRTEKKLYRISGG